MERLGASIRAVPSLIILHAPERDQPLYLKKKVSKFQSFRVITGQTESGFNFKGCWSLVPYANTFRMQSTILAAFSDDVQQPASESYLRSSSQQIHTLMELRLLEEL